MGSPQNTPEKYCNKEPQYLEHSKDDRDRGELIKGVDLQSTPEDENSTSVRENYSEEACMDFIIYELGYGSGLPRDFRYAQGIDQVRTRLMLRYGDRNLDRAMGIFNEILESRSASGLGDEGDVWRSWRHSHTHCRDDLSNPGTPRFSGMVIPAPKPRARPGTRVDVGRLPHVSLPEIRSQALSEPSTQNDQAQDGILIESLTSGSYQKMTLASVGHVSGANIGTTDTGGFPWGETERSTLHEVIGFPKRIISRRLKKRANTRTSPGYAPTVEALEGAVAVTQALPEIVSDEPKHSPSQTKVTPLILKWNDGYRYAADTLSSPPPQTWISQEVHDAFGPIQAGFEARVNQATHSKDVTYELLSRQPIPPNVAKVAISPTITKKVFSMFIKDSKSTKPSTVPLNLLTLEMKENKPSLARRRNANLPPLTLDGACDERAIDDSTWRLNIPLPAAVAAYMKKKRESRIKDYQNRAEQANSLKILFKLLSSRGKPSEYAINEEVIRRTIAKQSTTHAPILLSSNFCFRLCPLMVDNNSKDTSLDRDLFSSLAFQQSPLPNENPSLPVSDSNSNSLRGSTVCSNTHNSAISSKENFRNVTTSLLSPTLKPSRKPSTKAHLLDPKKYNPEAKLSKMDIDENRSRYEDVMNQNPFHEEPRGRHSNEHEMRNIKASKSNDAYHNFSGQPTYKPRAMYHSQSESNITYSTDSSAFSRPLLHSESFSGGTPSTRLTHQMGSAPRSPQRRWPSTRTPSPTKRLPDLPNLEENEELNFPMTPTKRSRSPTKRMFGEKGWLNQSPSAKDASSEQNRKTGIKALGGKIKQRMGDLTDVSRKIPNLFSSHGLSGMDSFEISTFAVSLDAQAQSKLLTELELMICTTANAYLKAQQNGGRMSVESLIKILKHWRGKGRPQVLEFHFDQITQRDLILANMKTFRFYGPNAENPISLLVMMQAWESMAKDMSIRTFCTPDFIIKKHMCDCYKILELLGAPLPTFLALQDIQVKTLKIMREEQRKRDEREALKLGVERRFDPPPLVSTHSSLEGSDRLGSFEEENGFF